MAEALAKAPDAAALQRALLPLDLEKLTCNDVSLLSRTLQARPGEPDVRVGYLANFTLDPLPRWVDLCFARERLRAAHYVESAGEYVEEVLGEDTGLAAFAPHLVLLALSLRRLRPEMWACFARLSPAERRDFREEVASHVESWALAAADRTPATLLVANFPGPAQPAFGVADLNDEYGETEFFLDLNLDLLRRFKGHPRVQVFDLDRLTSRFGRDRVLDRRMAYLASMEWSFPFQACVAAELARHARAARGQARRGLVLDLDTLWAGALAEDGPAGVRAGAGDPEGEACLDFQRRLKALQAQGVLLAACSRSNPADVREAFDRRPEMPLRLDDLTALDLSWQPRHEGVRKLAAALGLDTSSLVFMDTNPSEVSLVQQMLPEVKAVLLPADPADLTAALDRLTDFERTSVSPAEAWPEAQPREEEAPRAAAGDLGSCLATLRTELAFTRAKRDDLPRIH
ncbi:MAG TPA: HAD family hydrolase, partial [Thermoanaerobaculia bacterium]